MNESEKDLLRGFIQLILRIVVVWTMYFLVRESYPQLPEMGIWEATYIVLLFRAIIF